MTGGDERSSSPAWAREIPLESVGLVARLLRIHLLFGHLLDEATDAAGTTDSDYLVLALVERSPGGGSPTHIAQVLGRSTGGMTLTLDRLESVGWLRRERDPSDRRRVRLHLTAAGRESVERVRAALHGWEDALGLSADERAASDGAADRLIGLLSGTGAAGATPGT